MSDTATGAQRKVQLLKRSRNLTNLSLALLVTAAIVLISQIFEMKFTTASPLFASIPAIIIGYYAGRIRRQAEQIHP